jgi:serine/threonine-protein kinase RsbW
VDQTGQSPVETVLRLPAEPTAATRARHAAVALAKKHGAGAAVCSAIAIAVTEAVANVVVHAYRDGRTGAVEIVLRAGRRRLEAIVCDHGVGLLPRDDSPGLGLGLGLMAELADAFEVTPAQDGGTRVRLLFELA